MSESKHTPYSKAMRDAMMETTSTKAVGAAEMVITIETLRAELAELTRQRDEWKDASRETQRVLDVRLTHLDEARAQRDALLEAAGDAAAQLSCISTSRMTAFQKANVSRALRETLDALDAARPTQESEVKP